MKIRKIIIAIISIAVMLPALQSCKKGENDPGISLKSRSARLAGEWNVESATVVNTNSGGTTTITYKGSTITTTYSDGTPGNSGTFTWTYAFDKDGTYEEFYSTTYGGTTESEASEGNWNWAGANKEAEVKAKEMLLLHETKSTYTSSGGTDIYTYEGLSYNGWMIDKLSSKEIVMKYKNIYTSTSTYTTTMEVTLTK